MVQAIEVADVGCIRYCGRDAAILKRLKDAGEIGQADFGFDGKQQTVGWVKPLRDPTCNGRHSTYSLASHRPTLQRRHVLGTPMRIIHPAFDPRGKA